MLYGALCHVVLSVCVYVADGNCLFSAIGCGHLIHATLHQLLSTSPSADSLRASLPASARESGSSFLHHLFSTAARDVNRIGVEYRAYAMNELKRSHQFHAPVRREITAALMQEKDGKCTHHTSHTDRRYDNKQLSQTTMLSI